MSKLVDLGIWFSTTTKTSTLSNTPPTYPVPFGTRFLFSVSLVFTCISWWLGRFVSSVLTHILGKRLHRIHCTPQTHHPMFSPARERPEYAPSAEQVEELAARARGSSRMTKMFYFLRFVSFWAWRLRLEWMRKRATACRENGDDHIPTNTCWMRISFFKQHEVIGRRRWRDRKFLRNL